MAKSLTTLRNLFYRSAVQFLLPEDARKIADLYHATAKKLFGVLVRNGHSGTEAKELTIRFMEYLPDASRKEFYHGNEARQRAIRAQVMEKVIDPFANKLSILLGEARPHKMNKRMKEIEQSEMAPEQKRAARIQERFHLLDSVSMHRVASTQGLAESKREARAMGLQVVKPATYAQRKGWIPNRKSDEVQDLLRKTRGLGRKLVPRRR